MYEDDVKGHGVMMNSSYTVTESMYAPVDRTTFNMHELFLIDEGKTGLAITNRADWVDVRELNAGQDAGWISNSGFREFDVVTGETRFEWWALDHVSLSESNTTIFNLDGPPPLAGNFL